MGNGETSTNIPISNTNRPTNLDSANNLEQSNTRINPEIERLEQILNSLIERQGGNQLIGGPMNKKELEELYKRENSMCLINFETDSSGITMNTGIGTGFFCKLNHSYFPFQKALFTNNHILNQ